MRLIRVDPYLILKKAKTLDLKDDLASYIPVHKTERHENTLDPGNMEYFGTDTV